jgi:hypothetical protein
MLCSPTLAHGKNVSCRVQIVDILVTLLFSSLLSVPGSKLTYIAVCCVFSNILLLCSYLNSLEPSSYYVYRQFNFQQFYVLPTRCIYVFCVDLRTNSDYLTGFYNRDGVFLLRGTDWVFNQGYS